MAKKLFEIISEKQLEISSHQWRISQTEFPDLDLYYKEFQIIKNLTISNLNFIKENLSALEVDVEFDDYLSLEEKIELYVEWIYMLFDELEALDKTLVQLRYHEDSIKILDMGDNLFGLSEDFLHYRIKTGVKKIDDLNAKTLISVVRISVLIENSFSNRAMSF